MKRAHRLLRPRGQRGQAMIEFAIVLPILLILSFGTLEVGLYLQRRLVLGGAAFVAARAAAVQGGNAATAVKQVLDSYAQDSNSPWVAEAANTTTVKTESARRIRVNAVRQGDAWSGLLSGSVELEGGSLQPISKWTAAAAISQEFVPGKRSATSAARSPTDEMISYPVEVSWGSQVPDLGGALQSLPPTVAGLVGADVLVAADPVAQAVDDNPYNRHMNGHGPSDSKTYVGIHYEDDKTTQANLMQTGFPKLEAIISGIAAAYAAPSTPISPGLTAVIQGFARADQSIDFDKRAQNVQQAEKAIFALR